MEPSKKIRIKNALRIIDRDAEDVEMEEIEYTLWPEKIQMCLLSGGSSEEVEEISDVDSLGSLPRDDREIPVGGNSSIIDTLNHSMEDVSSTGLRILKENQNLTPIATVLTPPPSSGQQVFPHVPIDRPSQRHDEIETPDLPGIQQFKRMQELKQKPKRAGAKETEFSQKSQTGQKRRRYKSPTPEGEDDIEGGDIEGRIFELEHRETGLRLDCKNAIKVFSPMEIVAKTAWLQAPPKAKAGQKTPDERLRFIEERFRAFDNFIIKQIKVQEDEPIRFDSSAPVEARIKVLEEAAVELDRTLRAEMRKSEAWNRK